MTLNPKFEEMMQYPDIGHNGGKENAPLWFVGLENNAGNAENCIQHNQYLLAHPDDKDNRLDLDKQDFVSVFNQRLRAILGSDTKKVEELYGINNFFCANLYPFACTDADDDSNIHDLTGGLTKAQYYDYCDLHRHTCKVWHKFFEHAKTIVCMGKEHWLSFIMQFTTTPAELDTALCQYWQAYINNASPKIIVIDLDTRRLILSYHPGAYKYFNAADIIKEIERKVTIPNIDIELYERVKNWVKTENNTSISAIQRQFVIGYNVAAGIKEALQDAGVVSAPDATGKRHLLSVAEK